MSKALQGLLAVAAASACVQTQAREVVTIGHSAPTPAYTIRSGLPAPYAQ